jgi:outer membrane protein assembly factor BamB
MSYPSGMTSRALVLLALAIGMMLSRTAGAGDSWPRFRGPTGQGISDARGLPLEWAEDENVTWKTKIHGKAWSSPVILGKQIWMTTATEDGRQLFAVCLDKGTGKIIHDLKLFDVEKPQKGHEFNSYASPTPVVEPGRVYVTFGSPGTACLDSATGKIIWERRDFICNHYRNAGSSPLLYGDLFILPFDGSDYQYVVGLDKNTGETKWKTPRSIDFQDLDPSGKPNRDGDMRKAFSTPMLWEKGGPGGTPVVVSLGSKAMYAYRPNDGKEVFRIEHRQVHSGSVTPIIGDQFMYYCTGLGHEELWAVKPGGTGLLADTHIAWKFGRNASGRPSPLLVDGRIYMVDDGGIVSCVDAKTGAGVWSDRLDGNYSASPIYADGRIYFFNQDGVATVIEAGTKFKVLGQNELDDGFMASPAVADNALFLRTKSHLYRIEQSKK